eukprot:9275643-Alexandrium_andersonii.AAC.1
MRARAHERSPSIPDLLSQPRTHMFLQQANRTTRPQLKQLERCSWAGLLQQAQAAATATTTAVQPPQPDDTASGPG